MLLLLKIHKNLELFNWFVRFFQNKFGAQVVLMLSVPDDCHESRFKLEVNN